MLTKIIVGDKTIQISDDIPFVEGENIWIDFAGERVKKSYKVASITKAVTQDSDLAYGVCCKEVKVTEK